MPGPYPPDVSSTSQVVAIKNVPLEGSKGTLSVVNHFVNPSVPSTELCQELPQICAV